MQSLSKFHSINETYKNLHKLADLMDDLADREGVRLDQRAYFQDEYGDFLSVRDRLDQNNSWCCTCACTLGWATTHPEMPFTQEILDKNTDYPVTEYCRKYFPALGYSHLWVRIFSSSLSNDFRESAQRCRQLADELS